MVPVKAWRNHDDRPGRRRSSAVDQQSDWLNLEPSFGRPRSAKQPLKKVSCGGARAKHKEEEQSRSLVSVSSAQLKISCAWLIMEKDESR